MKGILLLGALGLIFVLQYQEAKAVATLADLENVVTLTAENFDEKIKKNHLLVLFYGSECQECDGISLTWNKLANDINKNDRPNEQGRRKLNKSTTRRHTPGISIAKANCSNEKSLCTEKCSWNEYRNCEDDPDAECNLSGEYSSRKWMKTLGGAKKVCEKDPDCGGITRDANGYEPRKGPKIGYHARAHELWLCKVSQSKDGSKCSKSNDMGLSCTCPSDCRICENCTSSRFVLEHGYPTLMFFEAGKNDGAVHDGPRDFDALIGLVKLKFAQGPPTAKSQSVLLMEAGCKKQDWEFREWGNTNRNRRHYIRKRENPYSVSLEPTGKLLATGVCIPNDYEKDFPPDDGTKRIYITIETHEVRGVDAKKKTLSIDFTLTMRWLDSRIKTNFTHLNDKSGGILLGPKAIEHIWYPDLEVSNRQSFKMKEEWASLITTRILASKHINELDGMNNTEYEFSIPTVEMRYLVKTTVYCKKWTYSNYPMDHQTCDVAFGSLSGSSEFTLYNTPDNDSRPNNYKAANFDITISYLDRDENPGCNRVGMTFRMQRLTTSFFFKYYGPCTAIVLVSEIGFIIPVTAIPGRVGLLVTQFLTLINLFIHQMSESPSESELNALGIYFIACLTFVVCALAEFAIALLIHQRRRSRTESENTNRSEDMPSEMAQQKNVTSSAVSTWVPNKPNFKDITEDHVFIGSITPIWKRISFFLVTCDIDLIAACIYLMVFVLFNCVYWIIF